ncbi:hypothetical protein [Microbulbifer marinus]|nr:hypothetical protein [Microbulbifer marinus]
MKTTIRTFAAFALAAAASGALAANDGNVATGVNAASQGDFQVNLNLGTAIVVKNLGDLTLDATTAVNGQPIVGREQICVGGVGFSSYSVDLVSTNGITGGGAGATFGFQLNGSAQNLEYSASFADDTNLSSTGDSADSSTGVVTGGSYLRNGTLGCTSDNAQVIVSVPNWESATETTYSDTLTVTVTAE